MPEAASLNGGLKGSGRVSSVERKKAMFASAIVSQNQMKILINKLRITIDYSSDTLEPK
jgi:hypothetical protein